MVKRKAMVVYFKSPKAVDEVKKYVNISYISKKLKYLVGYTDLNRYNKNKGIIKSLKGISHVEDSKFEVDRFDFNN